MPFNLPETIKTLILSVRTAVMHTSKLVMMKNVIAAGNVQLVSSQAALSEAEVHFETTFTFGSRIVGKIWIRGFPFVQKDKSTSKSGFQ